MPTRYYDRYGNSRGYSLNSKDLAEQAVAIRYLVGIFLLAAPFYPLYYVVLRLYDLLTARLGLHELLSGVVSIIIFGTAIYGLWRWRGFRIFYCIATTIFCTITVSISVAAGSDVIWAAFFGILTLAAGIAFTFLVEVLDRTFRPAAAQEAVAADDEPTSGHERSASYAAETSAGVGSLLSYPLNDDEAALLISKVSDAGWDLLEALCAGATEPGFASIAWKEAKAITKHRNWPEFVETTLAGLHGPLREVTGDPQARLIVDSDELYSRGKRPPGGRSLIIEGPAVEALQRQFAETYPR